MIPRSWAAEENEKWWNQHQIVRIRCIVESDTLSWTRYDPLSSRFLIISHCPLTVFTYSLSEQPASLALKFKKKFPSVLSLYSRHFLLTVTLPLFRVLVVFLLHLHVYCFSSIFRLLVHYYCSYHYYFYLFLFLLLLLLLFTTTPYTCSNYHYKWRNRCCYDCFY